MSDSLLEVILAPIERLVTPLASLYWLYLVSSSAIAAILFLIARGDRRRPTLRSALAYMFPSTIYLHPSAILDFKYFAFNTFFRGILIAPLLLTSQTVARSIVVVLVEVFGVPDAPFASGVAATVAATILLVAAADLGFYASHYLQHKVPVLWEFHKVHHSAEVLHPFSAFRAHPVDQFLDDTLMTLMTGVMIGLLAYGLGTSTGPVMILGVNALAFSFSVAGTHLRHSHIWLSFGRRLNHIVVSPAMHQIHHSYAARHINRNLGGMFTIWDWLMGTLYVPSTREQLTYGLTPGEGGDYSSVARLYLVPLQKVGKLWLGVGDRARCEADGERRGP